MVVARVGLPPVFMSSRQFVVPDQGDRSPEDVGGRWHAGFQLLPDEIGVKAVKDEEKRPPAFYVPWSPEARTGNAAFGRRD
jgi:hypothetical protein